MYNEDRKRRFIELKESDTTISQYYLPSIFNKAQPFEEKLAKDLCEWTITEIIEFYKYSDNNSFDSLSVIHSNYAQYASWCLKEGLVPDGQNHFLEMTPQTMLECVNNSYFDQSIITREELIRNVDQLNNYTDRFMFYALFEGICGADYCEIKEARVSDIEGNTIHLCTGRDIEISSKLKDVALETERETTYETFGENPRIFPYRPEDKGKIFKMVRNVSGSSNGKVIAKRYARCVNSLGISRLITPKRLMLSGKFHYIKEIMRKENLTIEEFLANDEYVEEVNRKFEVDKIRSKTVFLNKYARVFE